MVPRSFQNSSSNKTKQRLFGPAENALIKASLQYQRYMKVGVVLHLKGPYISLETLTSKIIRLQQRHPFLRSRLQNNPRKLDTYLMEEDETLRLKIFEIPRKREAHLSYWRYEWRKREKEPATLGEGLADFWLLQDPDDFDADDAPREIIIICEHSICDGLSLSTIAHELLETLTTDDENVVNNSLGWPIAMESAVKRSLSTWVKIVTFGKFISAALHWRATNTRPITRVPLASLPFPLSAMHKHCYTEAVYGFLEKKETRMLLEKCQRENVTVTSAISSAILHAISALISADEIQTTQLTFAVAVDTRRRCVPAIPNHDLSYQVSGIMAFAISTEDVSKTTTEGMWHLANTFGRHVKKSVNAGQTLALGMIMGKIYQRSLGPPNLAEVPTCGISNWGVLPFREVYRRWNLTAMTPMGNMIRAPMPFVLVHTVNGVLTIGFLGAAPIIPPSTIESLRDGTMHKLHQMLEN